MGDVAMDRTDTTLVEAILRDELARENRALRGVAPVISHMLESSGRVLVSDAIVARLRGMLAHLARQVLGATKAQPQSDFASQANVDLLSEVLSADSEILNHLYALAMEGHLAERLEQRSSVDPVLSPLMQELIASDQPAIAEMAMGALAAQSRFMQSQRRMELPLGELPSALLLAVLKRFRKAKLGLEPSVVEQACDTLKRNYDEGAGRLGLLARLVSAMRGGAIAALELDHAGLALFASAVASLAKQPRDLAILACHDSQAARLALCLRAAGLEPDAVERQFLLLEPSELLPDGLASVSPQRARELLAGSTIVQDFAETAV